MRLMATPDAASGEECVPARVLAAFGVSNPVRRLPGGQGTSVLADGLVLKPDADREVTAWLADLCRRVEPRGFRLAAPVPASDGHLVVDGWAATPFVEGTHVDAADRSAPAWLPVLETGRAFHRAVRGESRPTLLDRRLDRWAVADRAAWGDARAAPGHQSARLVERTDRLLVDERLEDQLVHGDLSGNVLLGPGLPAVIDVSPFWRPAPYADAVVVVDALLWWWADPELIDLGQPAALDRSTWTSLLARALVFRLLAFDESSRPASGQVDAELDRYDAVARLLEA
jgi:uncharacterized protein (TIGR02569 family)